MKPIRNKKKLEIKIQQIPCHPNPKVALEQYSTPATIAADILWNAYTLGDISDRNVLDLGCGCGIFAISSMLLGARRAVGVDIDGESLEVARNYADRLDAGTVEFVEADARCLELDFRPDTIFQNPPFGSQKFATRGIDLEFVDAAVRFDPEVLYSFHMASTEEFLIDYYSELGLEITHIFRYNFKIPKIYEFHTKEFKNVDVIVIRAVK